MPGMSSPRLNAGPAAGTRALPQGEEVASFASYAQAQFAVDALSDEGFPVEHLAIMGTDLRQIEHITGRMSWGRAAAGGLTSGASMGLFFGLLLALMGSGQLGTAGILLLAIVIGAMWGLTFNLFSYAAMRGRRDFTSVSAVVAARYSILASAYAEDAAQALADVPGNLSRGGEPARRAAEARRRAALTSQGPTAFGSRPDEQPRFGVRIEQLADASGAETGGLPSGGVSAAGAAGSSAPEQA